MNRRCFLLAGGSALALPPWRARAQSSLGALVWVEAGGIRVRELPDGRPATVASGTGLHSPRFSPSGAWIAYQKLDRGVFVVRSDGREGASFEGHGSMWLGQEDRLAVSRGSGVAVYSPANLWKSPEAFWKDAVVGPFRPDGQQYAGVRIHQHPANRDGLNQDRSELYVAAEERTVRVLIPHNEGEIRPHSWTRDGKQIIYWRADEWSGSIWADGIGLYAISASGGAERELGVASLAHADMLDLAPAVAGNKLVVASGLGRETWATEQLVLIDLDTGAKRELTPPETAALGPAWSPDGRKVAYFAAPDAELVEARAEAGTPMRILNPDGSVTTKVRTPDTRIGIGGGERAHRFLQLRKISVLDPVGGSPSRQLTEDPHYRDEEPLWSADSSHILFARMDYDGHASLWLMESSGSNARQVCQVNVYSDLPVKEGWFGFYGYIDWRTAFDWRR
jgi:Tol biopolymer transport system component